MQSLHLSFNLVFTDLIKATTYLISLAFLWKWRIIQKTNNEILISIACIWEVILLFSNIKQKLENKKIWRMSLSLVMLSGSLTCLFLLQIIRSVCEMSVNLACFTIYRIREKIYIHLVFYTLSIKKT
jgi:hypothetical protein